jgi:hypothetical protein
MERFNRTMPPSTVIPELAYEDVGEAIAWLSDKFGFTVRWRAGDHRAQLWLNGGTVVVTEPRTWRPRRGAAHPARRFTHRAAGPPR